MSARRLLLLPAVALTAILPAQDYLAKYPQYERYQKMRPEIAGSVVRGDLQVTWADDGKSFRFQRDGKWFRYDIPAKTAVEIAAPDQPQQQQGRGGRGGFPQRGRQFDTANSPDGKRVARHRDRNVYISDTEGKNEQAITTDGNAVTRVKNGIASWVYGEELGVREAMWWSPDSTKLAYYRFDESQVKDYFLAMKVREFQNELDVEAYPKAGAPNPTVMLFVYDLATKKSTKLDVAFDSGAGQDLAHYVYSVRWSPNGSELLFNRTNRKQNVMEFCAANPATGACRVIIREASPSSWTDNSPAITYLAPKAGQPQKFLWQSERTGYNHWFLYDLSGKLHSQVTKGDHEAGQIVTVDEAAGHLYYMARSGATPYLNQLHRVGLDGKGDARLTDPAFSHRVSLAPDKRHFVDVAETIDTPPTTRLLAMDGKVLATLAQSDLAKFEQMGLERVERFTFTAADGKTLCYGTLAKPSDFDASRKYPLVVSVYAGPESGGGIERFQTPDALTELGFLVAWIDGRGTSGRGKSHKDAAYGKLGVVEIDDQAAGVKELAKRPYVDGSRVAIHGTSYGGYASAMAILRHPDVFHVAVASSSVTDWRHYDTIYTERYMGLPWEGENKAGYDAGSAVTYAKNLNGKLMLYYGTADNNVHPANTYQLAAALIDAGKPFDALPGPDRGHTGIPQMFFIKYLLENLSRPAGPVDAH